MFVYRKLIFLFILVILSYTVFSQSNENRLSLSRDFEINGKYRIIQHGANLKIEPNINSDVIAILNLNDEIEILENVWNHEEINEVWGCWYKIKYGNIIGYTFGGNIARGSVITNIGDTIISVHFRITNVSGGNPFPVEGWLFPYVNQRTGIFIYVNTQRIYTNSILYQYELDYQNDEIYPTRYAAEWLDVENTDGLILIKLHSYGRRGTRFTTTYKVDENGNVEFLEYNYDGNRYRLDMHGNTWAKWNEWWDDDYWHYDYEIIDDIEIDGEQWVRYKRR